MFHWDRTQPSKDSIPSELYRFCDHVFKEPYIPYYDEYRGHIFRIDHYQFDADLAENENSDGFTGHVWLHCVDDPAIIVKGYVHFEDLEEVM